MLPTFICRFFCAKAVRNWHRFFCGRAARNPNRLDFCGERRIWSGEVLNREIKGNSVLYIYYEVCFIDQSDMKQCLRTLIRFIFHALGWLMSSWHQIPYVAIWDWKNNPYSWQPSFDCFNFRKHHTEHLEVL